MQKNSMQNVSQSKVKYTLSNFALHLFVAQNKSLLSQGNCLILQSKKVATQQGPAQLYIRFNNYELYKKLNQALFVKVKYQRSISYLFFEEKDNNLVYSISSHLTNNDLSLLQGIITQNASLIDYASENLTPEHKQKINYHIDKVLQNEIIINWTTTAKIAKGIGSFFGIISQKVTKIAQKTDQAINQKVDRFSKQNFSQNTHSKWQFLKDKASSINQKMTQVINPISQTIQSAAKDIQTSIQTSQNKFVKGFRQLANETEGALNHGFASENIHQLKEEPLLNNVSNQSQKPSKQIKEQSNQYPSL